MWLLARLNGLCGLPLFGCYAASLINIVTSAYASVVLSNVSAFDDLGAHTKVASYTVYIMLFLWRVIAYSVYGSHITEKNAALAETLTTMDWSVVSKADRRRKKAFLQIVKLPFNVTAMGFFIIEKSNILAVFGFIMTYFIILLQMGEHPQSDTVGTSSNVTV
ncbi:hypothetical protein FJT64_004891 [Amphibalanus amphitrite]|uniref:Uncharacterized protein n=1 Tax=Amphibalanus amphitrite TaxID=1232801 RepID=A0A6A4W1R1_AMPAM|nr:hypothetical protein FJT64_004891 [Amphibalanus amphitrite]